MSCVTLTQREQLLTRVECVDFEQFLVAVAEEHLVELCEVPREFFGLYVLD